MPDAHASGCGSWRLGPEVAVELRGAVAARRCRRSPRAGSRARRAAVGPRGRARRRSRSRAHSTQRRRTRRDERGAAAGAHRLREGALRLRGAPGPGRVVHARHRSQARAAAPRGGPPVSGGAARARSGPAHERARRCPRGPRVCRTRASSRVARGRAWCPSPRARGSALIHEAWAGMSGSSRRPRRRRRRRRACGTGHGQPAERARQVAGRDRPVAGEVVGAGLALAARGGGDRRARRRRGCTSWNGDPGSGQHGLDGRASAATAAGRSRPASAHRGRPRCRGGTRRPRSRRPPAFGSVARARPSARVVVRVGAAGPGRPRSAARVVVVEAVRGDRRGVDPPRPGARPPRTRCASPAG